MKSRIDSSSLNQASTALADFKQLKDHVPSLQTSMTEVMNKMTDLETQKTTLRFSVLTSICSKQPF